jgi:cell division transport system ATP-binding protein
MRLLHLFEELNKLGTTIVIATHNEMLIERFGYARMILDKGMLQHLPRSAAATRIA